MIKYAPKANNGNVNPGSAVSREDASKWNQGAATAQSALDIAIQLRQDFDHLDGETVKKQVLETAQQIPNFITKEVFQTTREDLIHIKETVIQNSNNLDKFTAALQ